MTRDLAVEEEILSKKIRPVRKDGIILLVDKVSDGTMEKVTSGGVIVNAPLGDIRIGTVMGLGVYVGDLSRGDRVAYHKAYGNFLPLGFGDEKLILVTANQVECLVEDESCLG